MNLSGYKLVCDYHIDNTAFNNALKEYNNAVIAKKDAENKAEVDNWADDVFASFTNNAAASSKNNNENLIKYNNYSIYESYLLLSRIKNEADDKQTGTSDLTTPNESDFIAQYRFGDIGRTLKTAFLYGPSASIKSKGKIYIEINGKADKDEVADDEKRLSDEIKKANKNSKNNNENLIKYNNYSIYESYLLLSRIKNEADDESSSTQQKQDMKSADKFKSGSTWIIRTILEDEGYSEWKIFINSNVPNTLYDTIKGLLKKGKFKDAYNAAGKHSKGIDGIVPISCKTYIAKKPKCGVPWFGHCRYGFALGGENNDSTIANTLFLSVAPFNATKGVKPDVPGSSDEILAFKSAYDITGDITHGKVNSLLTFCKKKLADQIYKVAGRNSDDRYDVNDNELNNDISKFINNKFKCIGDSTMYDDFLKIREYLSKELNIQTEVNIDTDAGKQITKELNNNNLQINTNEITEVNTYMNKVESKKALIFY